MAMIWYYLPRELKAMEDLTPAYFQPRLLLSDVNLDYFTPPSPTLSRDLETFACTIRGDQV
jgi:hypothetical protein